LVGAFQPLTANEVATGEKFRGVQTQHIATPQK